MFMKKNKDKNILEDLELVKNIICDVEPNIHSNLEDKSLIEEEVDLIKIYATSILKKLNPEKGKCCFCSHGFYDEDIKHLDIRYGFGSYDHYAYHKNCLTDVIEQPEKFDSEKIDKAICIAMELKRLKLAEEAEEKERMVKITELNIDKELWCNN